MIKELIIPSIYLIIISVFVIKSKYFKRGNIHPLVVFGGFVLKIASAFYFGYLFKHHILNGGDTLTYFNDGNIVFSSLKDSVLTYLHLVFGNNDYKPVEANLLPYTTDMSFWYDTSNYFIVRINALIRLISFGSYNVHAIFFSLLSFIGTYNLYLFFEDKVYNKKVLQFILFGIPSIVFWTSGVHKEAIIIFSLGIILYNVDKIVSGVYTKKNLLVTVLGLILLGCIRVYLLAFLLPLIASIMIYVRLDMRKSSIHIYLFTILAFIMVFTVVNHYFLNIQFIDEFLVRRNHFLNLNPGNTTFDVVTNLNTTNGFLYLISEAFINPFIRPLPTESNFILVLLASLETYVLLFTVIGLLFTINFKSLYKNPYAVFCILYALSILFLIGLIVNNSGAIVRYRSIAIPFLLIGLCLKQYNQPVKAIKTKLVK
ncbi:MAG: hypothetical protein H6553_06250 [Chitinophagales bacterium]|nr:hypothetical protein [Chitinophagales bacterium]